MKYTDTQLLQTLKTEYASSGIIPAYGFKRSVHVRVYTNRFGSWSKTLELAGIPLKPKLKIPRYTKICQYGQCSEEFITTNAERECCTRACANKRRAVHPYKEVKTRDEWRASLPEKSLRYMMDTDFTELSWDIQRKRILHEQDNKCNRCGISEWMDEPLPIEIDHKDGDNINNIRSNLEGLCPNCHSLTPTWRGRNKVRNKVPDSVLIEALKETDNVRQALLLVGMAAKGANYKRATRLLDAC